MVSRRLLRNLLNHLSFGGWGVWDAWGVDEVTWGALTLTLTLIGGLWTVYAFRRRGVASGLRGAGHLPDAGPAGLRAQRGWGTIRM